MIKLAAAAVPGSVPTRRCDGGGRGDHSPLQSSIDASATQCA